MQGEVDIDACFWTLEETSQGKVVDITLAKKAMGYNNWEALLETDRADLSATAAAGKLRELQGASGLPENRLSPQVDPTFL
eukprot:1160246-Pelagomonas_calceolata.AAC.2